MRDLVGQTPQMGHIMNFLRILTTGSVFLMANLTSVSNTHLHLCPAHGSDIPVCFYLGRARLPHLEYHRDDPPEPHPPPARGTPRAEYPPHSRAPQHTRTVHARVPPIRAQVVGRQGRRCACRSPALSARCQEGRVDLGLYAHTGGSILVLIDNPHHIAYRHDPFSCVKSQCETAMMRRR